MSSMQHNHPHPGRNNFVTESYLLTCFTIAKNGVRSSWLRLPVAMPSFASSAFIEMPAAGIAARTSLAEGRGLAGTTACGGDVGRMGTGGLAGRGLAARGGAAAAATAGSGPRSGLPARLPTGLWFLLPPPNLSFRRLRVPSLSAPDPARSASLPDAASPARDRFNRLTPPTLGWLPDGGGADVGPLTGVREREGGPLGVLAPVPSSEALPGLCVFLRFLAADSLPLSSETLGEPGRLMEAARIGCFLGSGCLPGRWEGVLWPLVEVPEGGCGAPLAALSALSADSAFSSLSLFFESSLDSVSVSSCECE